MAARSAGWTWQPERYDLGNGIVEGTGLTLAVDVDVFGATLQITTDSLG